VRTVATELVKPRHAYTSEDVPWQIDDDGGSALFRYMRGGGVRAFGRTSAQAARAHRQSRFLAIFGVMSIVWLLLWIF
jgi:hypothetical protein